MLNLSLPRSWTFDEQKRVLFLRILSTQLKAGRGYQDVFTSMAKSRTAEFRELATRSLDARSEFFASRYGGFYPAKTVSLLILSQRFNAVTEYIENALSRSGGHLSSWKIVIKPNLMEIFLLAVGVVGLMALYLFNDTLSASLIDLSGTYAFQAGQFLTTFLIPFFILLAAGTAGYLYFRTSDSPLRKSLKKAALYEQTDSLFAIEIFRIMGIMTSSNSSKGANPRELIDEIGQIYATNPLRRSQFRKIRASLQRGERFTSAIAQSEILAEEELDLFQGMAPNEKISEISAACKGVAELMEVKLQTQLEFMGKTISAMLLFSLVFVLTLFVDITFGGGLSLFSANDFTVGN